MLVFATNLNLTISDLSDGDLHYLFYQCLDDDLPRTYCNLNYQVEQHDECLVSFRNWLCYDYYQVLDDVKGKTGNQIALKMKIQHF